MVHKFLLNGDKCYQKSVKLSYILILDLFSFPLLYIENTASTLSIHIGVFLF